MIVTARAQSCEPPFFWRQAVTAQARVQVCVAGDNLVHCVRDVYFQAPKATAAVSSTSTGMPRKLALVRWLQDESVGVMPLSAAKDDPSTMYPGKKTTMRWKGKKQYEVQILKLSGELQNVTSYSAPPPIAIPDDRPVAIKAAVTWQ